MKTERANNRSKLSTVGSLIKRFITELTYTRTGTTTLIAKKALGKRSTKWRSFMILGIMTEDQSKILTITLTNTDNKVITLKKALARAGDNITETVEFPSTAAMASTFSSEN
eukprot:12553276-Heterocapsa_arctica.AAC.1